VRKGSDARFRGASRLGSRRFRGVEVLAVAATSQMGHPSGMIRGRAVLFVAALGCSRAMAVGPAPEQPVAPPPVKLSAGTYKLFVSSTHEMSCSQSFQSDSEYASLELTIASDGGATLAVKTSKRSVFGPSGSKFSGGPSTKNETRGEYRYVGHATGDRIDMSEEKSAAKLAVTCKPTVVTIDDSSVDAGKSQLDALACSGLPFLTDEARAYFKGPAPLAAGTGVMFGYDDHGHSGPHTSFRKGI